MEEMLFWFIVGAFGGWFCAQISLFFWDDKIMAFLDWLYFLVRRKKP